MDLHEPQDAFFNQFPPHYRAFFKGIVDDGGAGIRRIEEYARILERPNISRDIISVSHQLGTFITIPELADHPNVKQGREILSNFFEPKKAILKKNNAIPLVYGSLIYDDPVHLDFDVQIFGMGSRTNIPVAGWETELVTIWQNEEEGHLRLRTVDEYTHYLRLFQNIQGFSDLYTYATRIDEAIEDIGIAFAGVPIFDEDTKQQQKLQRSFMALFEEDPIFAVLPLHALEGALQTRLDRRA